MYNKRKWFAAGILCLVLVTVFFSNYFYAHFSSPKGKRLGFTHDKIAVIEIEGILTDAKGIVQEIIQYKERNDVRAVVLRIDSPGGAVVPAQEIYEELCKLKKEKKVLASLGNVAASGGYYVACAANEIIANPSSLTGSIGVISEYPNLEKLMDKIGWKSLVIKSGRYKDMGNPMREMSTEEKHLLQALIDNVHKQFVHAVAEGRNMDLTAIEPLADGRLFTGEQAKARGLIDRLGNFQDALERAGELAGIKGKPVVIYPEEKKLRIWKLLFQNVSEWVDQYVLEDASEDRYGSVHIR